MLQEQHLAADPLAEGQNLDSASALGSASHSGYPDAGIMADDVALDHPSMSLPSYGHRSLGGSFSPLHQYPLPPQQSSNVQRPHGHLSPMQFVPRSYPTSQQFSDPAVQWLGKAGASSPHEGPALQGSQITRHQQMQHQHSGLPSGPASPLLQRQFEQEDLQRGAGGYSAGANPPEHLLQAATAAAAQSPRGHQQQQVLGAGEAQRLQQAGLPLGMGMDMSAMDLSACQLLCQVSLACCKHQGELETCSPCAGACPFWAESSCIITWSNVKFMATSLLGPMHFRRHDHAAFVGIHAQLHFHGHA